MIEVKSEHGLRRLILNRPDKANALTAEMLNKLADQTEAAQREGDKVLVITSIGKVFSAGADLEAVKAGLATDPVWEHLSNAIAQFSGLSITALNGTLAGGAFGMALACDIRIAVPEAKFFYPVMKLGYLPQPSDPSRLTALIGPARAKMILMGGQKVTSDEALSWGLVDRVVAKEELNTTIDQLTADVLGASPQHVHAIKGMIQP